MEKPETYAVIQTGGKQYLVYDGCELFVEKLAVKSSVTFSEILLMVNRKKVLIGNPYVKNAKVKAKILDQVKGKKIKGFKYKTGTQYRRRYGHRQKLSHIKVEKVSLK